MLVSFSKALKSANTVSVFTGWKLEFNKWLNLCYFLKESVAWEGFWIFSRRDMNQSRERGEEKYNIQMALWCFFHQVYGQAKVSVPSLDITWEENTVA